MKMLKECTTSNKMGATETKFDFVGKTAASKPTSVGDMFISKFAGFLVSKFYQEPSQKSYDAIIEHDEKLTEWSGEPHDFFKLKVRSKWNLEPALSGEDLEILNSKEKYLLNPDSKLNACDLDTLWSLFYATGDQVYPDRVYKVSQDKSQHPLVAIAAIGSYNSHREKGVLNNILTPTNEDN